MKRHQIAKAGQVILSEIWGKKGAIGFVPPEGEGALCTSHFFLFDVCPDRIEPSYLDLIFKANYLENQLNAEAKGTTGYAAVRPKHLLVAEIPLPPLAEQRRIVAKIEELAAQIDEVRTLRQEAVDGAEALHLSVLHQHFVENAAAWASMPMEEAIEINDRQVNPTLPEYSRLPHISGENMESRTCRLLSYRSAEDDAIKSNNYLFSSGTILYSKIRPYLRKAVYVDFQGVCSADIYPIRVISPRLDPHFVKWSLVADPFTDYTNRLSGRTRMPKLNRKQLFGFTFLYPPLPDQCRIVAKLDALQAEVEALTGLQAETGAELEALLPSILDKAFKGEL
jgi:type I restriction enzyme S subunit